MPDARPLPTTTLPEKTLPETTPLLRVSGLSKDYATRVLDAVDLELAHGEVHALVGANGAGKSTLCRILSGLTMPSAGEMELVGAPYRPTGKRDAEEAGVQIVQQELHLVSSLTVAENLFLNRLPHRLGWIDAKHLQRQACAALERVGLELDGDTPLHRLGVGTQQLVEIAAALSRDCRLLILDEPTAALTAAETERLFELVRELRRSGVGIVYVSHRLDEIDTISDRITVLRDGRLVATTATSATSIADMVTAMTGEQEAVATAFESYQRQEVALRVEHLSRGELLRDVSLDVRRGERLGIAGLVGSGRSELLRAIFGADEATTGAVCTGTDQTAPRFRHPRDAVRHGLAMVTEDRQRDGLLLPLSVRVNSSLTDLPRRGIWLDRKREVERAQQLHRSLETRCRSIEQPTNELSGGNQQKVVVAKWLAADADVYLLDEPTRGIDVAARRRLDRLFAELAERGKALVIVASDIDELMALCDAIVVLNRGRLVARFDRSDWSRASILAACFDSAFDSPAPAHELRP